MKQIIEQKYTLSLEELAKKLGIEKQGIEKIAVSCKTRETAGKIIIICKGVEKDV